MTNFYIRIRGRVQGPFTPEQLRALAQRGRFSRLHEVSKDKTCWRRAADFPNLFPEPATPKTVQKLMETMRLQPKEATLTESPAYAESPNRSGDEPRMAEIDYSERQVDAESGSGSTGDELSAQSWHYTTNSVQQSPVPFDRLQEMAAIGELMPHDFVWTNGMELWEKAVNISGLFGGRTHEHEMARSWAALSTDASRQPGEQTARTSRIAISSFVLGILGTNVLILLGSILAIFFGHLALAEIRRSGGRRSGRGLAMAGLLLGYMVVIAALVVSIVTLVLIIINK